MKYMLKFSLAIACFNLSCVGNVFCDPHKGSKKGSQDAVNFSMVICVAEYQSGAMTPTAAQDPKYADPAVASAEASKRLNDCILVTTVLIKGMSTNSSSVCE